MLTIEKQILISSKSDPEAPVETVSGDLAPKQRCNYGHEWHSVTHDPWCPLCGLVVHVPHASLSFPEGAFEHFIIDREALMSEAIASADLYTDLIAQEAWPQARHVMAEVSRIVVDVERYDDDQLEEMAAVGRGVIYTHDHNGNRIRGNLSTLDRSELLSRYYHPHWLRLRGAAAGAVLIDLHSYPLLPWSIEGSKGGARPEIDIGFSPGLTPAPWVDALTGHLRSAGYDVGHNTPYSGVIDAGARAAVMIEIRRDVLGSHRSNNAWGRLIEALSTLPLPAPLAK